MAIPIGRTRKSKRKIKKRDGIKLEEAGSEIKQSPWAELPEDLLIEIKSRLLYSDQVRFHTVCKNWLAVYTKPLPWVIRITYSSAKSLICKLYEPSPSTSNIIKPNLVYQLNFNEYDIHPYSLDTISTIHKNGWIFCSAKDPGSQHKHFLLFSPFTKKLIKFHPKSKRGKASLCTFSMDPNSRDCIFLILFGNSMGSKRITIRTLCEKDKNWIGRKFDRPKYFGMCGRFPVYIKGTFYFVYPVGQLASYNVDRYEWKVESVKSYDIFPEFLRFTFYEAFELNEELILICIKSDNSGIIARLDWCQKVWVPLESLGNHSVFCSNESILVSPIGKEERGKGILSNKVYYSEWGYINVYSLERGKLVSFINSSGIGSWDEIVIPNKSHWFQPPPLLKEKLSLEFWKKNNPKDPFSPIVEKQWPHGTETGIVKELGNLEMDETGEQSIEEDEDDELENLRILDQMRRSRNVLVQKY